MPKLNRSQLSDLRGVTRMATDASAAIAEVVETMHGTIQRLPGPLGAAIAGRPRGISGLVYRCVREGIDLVGQAVDASLGAVTPLLPDGEISPRLDAYRAAANGVYGDYLLRTDNPLAITMSLRHRGRDLDLLAPVRAIRQHPDVTHTNKLLVLVHGLCMNDRHWQRNDHDHGAALASEQAYLPLYLRYNSGLSIASNGQQFAQVLETVIANWTEPVDELVIVGHSMGGLVARSACHHGRKAGHLWPTYLRKLVFLGTPHHGAPLERGGHGLDLLMQLSPYSVPFTRLSKSRSTGITDLRHGAVWTGDEPVPLPAGVQCYAVAAVRSTRHSPLGERLIGDGLVPLHSALGRHHNETRTLPIPANRQWVGYGIGHLALLDSQATYRQLSVWLREP